MLLSPETRLLLPLVFPVKRILVTLICLKNKSIRKFTALLPINLLHISRHNFQCKQKTDTKDYSKKRNATFYFPFFLNGCCVMVLFVFLCRSVC